jgi:hypothetical protein
MQLHISAAMSLTSLQTTSTDCWGSLKSHTEVKHKSKMSIRMILKTYFLKWVEREGVLICTEYGNVQLTFQVLFLRDVSLDKDYSVFPIFFGKRQSSIFAILAVNITH